MLEMLNASYKTSFAARRLPDTSVVSGACKRLGERLVDTKPERMVKLDRYTSLSTVKSSDNNSLYNLVLNIKKNDAVTSVNTLTSKSIEQLKKYLNNGQAVSDIKENLFRMHEVIKKSAGMFL